MFCLFLTIIKSRVASSNNSCWIVYFSFQFCQFFPPKFSGSIVYIYFQLFHFLMNWRFHTVNVPCCLNKVLWPVFLLFYTQDVLFLSFNSMTITCLGVDLCVHLTWSLLRSWICSLIGLIKCGKFWPRFLTIFFLLSSSGTAICWDADAVPQSLRLNSLFFILPVFHRASSS